MRRIIRQTQGHARVSRDRWLVSYADFITLLFAFFATLYAISKVDVEKLSRVAQSMQVAFDDHGKAKPRTDMAGRTSEQAILSSDGADANDDVQTAVARDLAAELSSEQLQLLVDRRGVTLSIPEAGTFAVGRDELSETAQTLIARVAQALSAFPNAVRVEGHTDDVPIHTLRFQSNWDLSAARASRVVEFLIARGLSPERFSATGFAEFHPRVPNISADARASNRRIDLVILNATTTAAEEPVQTGRTP